MTALVNPGTRRSAHGDARRVMCRGGQGCAGHDWLVTAPQMRPRFESIDREPWGTYHLKQNGSAVTACGRSALTWHVFWGRHADSADRDACPDCISHVARHRRLVEHGSFG